MRFPTRLAVLAVLLVLPPFFVFPGKTASGQERTRDKLKEASELLEKHELTKAKEAVREVFEGSADEGAETYVLRGRVRAALGDATGAADDLAEAISLDPRSPLGYFHRAELLREQGKTPEAIEDFQTAFTKDRSFHAALLGLARACQADFDAESALKTYELALDRREASKEERALALSSGMDGLEGGEKEKRIEEAVKELEEAFDKGFKGIDRIKNERGLDAIRDHERVKALLQRAR